MKNILNIDNGIPTLLSNVDDSTNTLYINDELVPSSEWTGTGYYTFTSGGLTFTIQKIRDTSGNIMLQLIEQSGGTSYRLIKAISIDDKYYSIDDPAETDLEDGDYLPFYDTSAGRKKKTLWSNIVDKLKSFFLSLTGGTISGDITYKFTDADLTKANNNVSSIQYPTTFNILDVGNRIFARMEGKVHPNGDTGIYWYIRNYNTSGAQVGQKGIEMRMTKDGTFSYLVEEESKFRSAIHAAYSSANNGVADNATNANYATSAGSATNATKVNNWYSRRPTSANVQFGDGFLRHFKATSSMSEGKPTIGDAHILHMAWDNNGGWDGEIALGTSDGMQFRNQNLGTWRDWLTIIHSSNIGDQVVAGVKDYYAPNMVTKFGYGSPGMAQSAVTWLGAWDATVSGEYRLRGVRQADLKVAHAANATTYQEIFDGCCSAANSWQTKILASNYKFSTYKFLIFETRQYGNTTQVYVEAVDRFKQHRSTGNRIIMQAATGEQYQVYYVSDTQIALTQTQINGTYLTLHIYGMIGV